MNPWQKITLDAYENHMQLASVMQLQALNTMMKEQLASYPVTSVMILGIAGGNGLEHIKKDKFQTVYGIDVNASYLHKVKHRYENLSGVLECLCVDLMEEADRLPTAELVIANLLIEYIGYVCFQKTIRQAEPAFVSCIMQINVEEQWVSDSPYTHIFDVLEPVHHQIEETALEEAMMEIGYHTIKRLEHPLPNGKKLVQMDFRK